ncbi:hypothetical protein Bpfe_012193 [Biomphalaria pfeifferi]|uniref:Uncharacterized protein n=1 Tax=Biomphalaria pfeifferi TaxID=112525 RepID=A0AAD8FCN9_BIOPF|nr:hypothetical protein Bpfe_012193 [Biomphalaria pfeifferi]
MVPSLSLRWVGCLIQWLGAKICHQDGPKFIITAGGLPASVLGAKIFHQDGPKFILTVGGLPDSVVRS